MKETEFVSQRKINMDQILRQRESKRECYRATSKTEQTTQRKTDTDIDSERQKYKVRQTNRQSKTERHNFWEKILTD